MPGDTPEVVGPRPVDVAASMRYVARELGKSRVRQLIEIVRLSVGGARLSPPDYYRQRLYDDRLSLAEKRQFLSNNRYWEIVYRVSDERWFATADDKLVSSSLLHDHGIAVPRVKAVLHRFRSHPGAIALRTPESLAVFLRNPGNFPLFAKPCNDTESRASAWLTGYDRERDALARQGEPPVPVDDFVSRLWQSIDTVPAPLSRFDPTLGFMFQEVVRQHTALTELCGETVASARGCVFLADDGPRVLSVLWKVPAPWNFADNFSRRGNLLAAVDLGTGEVRRVIRGTGIEMEEFEHNPYNGKRLLGVRLPFFDELIETLKQGAAVFPKVRFQGWDIAIGPAGPIVLEVNNGTAFPPAQMVMGRGLLTDEFRDLVRQAEAANPTRPWSWLAAFSPRVVGHHQGPFHGAYEFVRRLLGGT